MSNFSFIILAINLFSGVSKDEGFQFATDRVKYLLGKINPLQLTLFQIFSLIEMMGRQHEAELKKRYGGISRIQWPTMISLEASIRRGDCDSAHRLFYTASIALICIFPEKDALLRDRDGEAIFLLKWALFPEEDVEMMKQLSELMRHVHGNTYPWDDLIRELKEEVATAFSPD